MNRPCIDPLDPDCPSESPNYYSGCEGLQFLKDDLAINGRTLDEALQTYKHSSDSNIKQTSETSVFDIFGAFCKTINICLICIF